MIHKLQLSCLYVREKKICYFFISRTYSLYWKRKRKSWMKASWCVTCDHWQRKWHSCQEQKFTEREKKIVIERVARCGSREEKRRKKKSRKFLWKRGWGKSEEKKIHQQRERKKNTSQAHLQGWLGDDLLRQDIHVASGSGSNSANLQDAPGFQVEVKVKRQREREKRRKVSCKKKNVKNEEEEEKKKDASKSDRILRTWCVCVGTWSHVDVKAILCHKLYEWKVVCEKKKKCKLKSKRKKERDACMEVTGISLACVVLVFSFYPHINDLL